MNDRAVVSVSVSLEVEVLDIVTCISSEEEYMTGLQVEMNME